MTTKLELNKILDFYDVPQVFLGKDIVGTDYLCLLYDDKECYRYIAIKISTDKIGELLTKKVDLRSLFVNPEIKDDYYVVAFLDNSYCAEKYIHIGELPEEMLPEDGYFLDGEEDDSVILSEAIKYNHPVIHLGFEDPVNSHSIPVSTLSVLITHYQSMVTNCFKKIDGTKEDRDFRLRVFAYSAASFNVHMYAESEMDLFGTSRIDKTLYVLDSLLKCKTDDELKGVLLPLKGHTIRSYKNFIKELIDQKINVKYKWVSSVVGSKVVRNNVRLPRLEEIYQVLNESSELEKEIKCFEGVITASSITTGKWTLKQDNGAEISGKTNSLDLLYGVVLGKVRYMLTCEEILEQNNVSSKEKATYILTDITEAKEEEDNSQE